MRKENFSYIRGLKRIFNIHEGRAMKDKDPPLYGTSVKRTPVGVLIQVIGYVAEQHTSLYRLRKGVRVINLC